MEWAMIQGIISLIIAVAAFYYARKKDTHEASAQVTEMIVNLRTMTRDIGDLKTDVQAMRQEWRDDHDKLVGMERDIRAIWKHIDRINEKEAEDE